MWIFRRSCWPSDKLRNIFLLCPIFCNLFTWEAGGVLRMLLTWKCCDSQVMGAPGSARTSVAGAPSQLTVSRLEQVPQVMDRHQLLDQPIRYMPACPSCVGVYSTHTLYTYCTLTVYSFLHLGVEWRITNAPRPTFYINVRSVEETYSSRIHRSLTGG
jgi:hypothetical protein